MDYVTSLFSNPEYVIINDVLIKRNVPIPCDGTRTYPTTENYQETMSLCVLEGESNLACDCYTIKVLQIENLQPRPAGQTIVNLSYQINESS